MNDIFDIAHARALDIMKIESDKQFLIAQRTKGRPGCLLGIDRKNQKLEECIEKNLKYKLERKKEYMKTWKSQVPRLFVYFIYIYIFNIYNIL